jgi:hypothetical protein
VLGEFGVFAVLGVFGVLGVLAELGVFGVLAVTAVRAVAGVLAVLAVGAVFTVTAGLVAWAEGVWAGAEEVTEGLGSGVAAVAMPTPPRTLRPRAPVTAQAAVERVIFMVCPFGGVLL